MNYRVAKELPKSPRMVRESRVDWAEAKRVLIQNEGDWVLIAEDVPGSTATQLRDGKNKHFRGEELKHFEFANLKPQDHAIAASYGPKRTDLWGRYTA